MNPYFLSSCVPAKPGIAKGLIEPNDIGRKAVADFIDSLLSENLRALRSVFGQHDILYIGHNVDLELTLLCLLGPVPWSLSTPVKISTKTDKSKLLHGLQSHIEPTLDKPCSATHSFDSNAILQSIIAFPFTFKDLMEPVFNQALKTRHVGFVTDTYIYIMYKQQSIKSYKHYRRG